MDIKSPIKEPSKKPPTTFEIKFQHPLHPSSETTTTTPPGAPESFNSKDAPIIAATAPLQPPSTSDTDTVYIPSYSRWFSWKGIHDCEIRFLPEFFDGKSPSKNPRVYKYYRNSIIARYRENPTAKISFTEARKSIIGDVGSVRRVFDFLEAWGLINYTGSTSKPPLKWDEKETKSSATSNSSTHLNDQAANPSDSIAPKKRLCSGCKSVCSIACFVSEKFGLTLCARCYVRGNYRGGVNFSDFKRVEISEEIKADWTDKETLHLLEAAMHFGDDWKKVAEHVGGRTERECVNRFIKLPFGEQFMANHPDSVYDDSDVIKDEFREKKDQTSSLKRMRFNPLADASNPIIVQAAFLSALVGVSVAEATAEAAIAALSQVDDAKDVKEKGYLDSMSHIERDERDLERAIRHITEVEMKEIQEKILKCEEVDLQMEKEWQQLHQMKNLLFADQLTLMFNKPTSKTATPSNAVVVAAPNTGGGESSNSTREEEEETIVA